MGILAL
jgi:hypothetical protein